MTGNEPLVTTPNLALPLALPSARRVGAALAYPVLILGLLLVLAGYAFAAVALLRLVLP